MKKEKKCRYCGEKLNKNNECLKCGKNQSKFLHKQPLLIAIGIVVILICISIGIIFNTTNSIYKKSNSTDYSDLENIFTNIWDDDIMTADELVKEYEQDLNDGELEYDGICLGIKGNIKNIEEKDNVLKIELKVNSESDYKVYCYFDKEDNDEIYDELKNYKENTEITAVGEIEKDGHNLNINYCIFGDWNAYYDFYDEFDIDVDLDNLIESINKDDENISLNDKNIMSFDNDILDYGYSYEEILDKIEDISQGEVEITNINEKSGFQSITITMDINGKETSIKVDNKDDTFDESLVYQINKVLIENNSDKLFYIALREYDEDFYQINIAYSTQSDITKINKTLKKSNLDINDFKKEGKSTSI